MVTGMTSATATSVQSARQNTFPVSIAIIIGLGSNDRTFKVANLPLKALDNLLPYGPDPATDVLRQIDPDERRVHL